MTRRKEEAGRREAEEVRGAEVEERLQFVPTHFFIVRLDRDGVWLLARAGVS